MIFAEKRTFQEGLAVVAPQYLMFGFSSIEPTKESEFPFDNNDFSEIVANSKACSLLDIAPTPTHLKFLHNKVLVPYKGLNDFLLLTPNNISVNFDYPLENQLALLGNIPNNLAAAAASKVGDYMELDLGDEINVDRVQLDFTSVSYMPKGFDLEYWDGSAWQVISSHTNSEISFNIPVGVVTSKLRVMQTLASPYGWNTSNFSVFANERPLGEPSDETITWVMLVPTNFEAESVLLDGVIPAIYCKAVAPNSGGDAVLTDPNPSKGMGIRLIHLKIETTVVET